MREILVLFLTQLGGQSPLLLAYLVGIVLALVFWRRYPRPCAFTLVAMGLLVLTLLGQTFLGAYFVVYRGAGVGWGAGRVGRVLMVNTLIGSLIRALAFGLLLAAVFVGREPAGRVQDSERPS
ncbi:MAG: hypothetical protein D6759_06865 [Chloroflexi bacterium]|nr:MAG: hypothetical protein D6759_06865 [Chloroflexota bacterium]